MMYFTFFINFVESYMFSYFLANYFKLAKKDIYILVTSLIQTAILTHANYINENGILLSTIIIVFMIVSLVIWQRKILFDYIYIVLLYNCFIIIIALLGIFIINVFSYIHMNLSDNLLYFIKCFISKRITLSLYIFPLNANKALSLCWELLFVISIYLYQQ